MAVVVAQLLAGANYDTVLEDDRQAVVIQKTQDKLTAPTLVGVPRTYRRARESGVGLWNAWLLAAGTCLWSTREPIVDQGACSRASNLANEKLTPKVVQPQA